jgi:hypothetical protein
MLLQNFLYDGEKDFGGCVGIINQRKIRYMAGRDEEQKYDILKLSYWFEITKDIEQAYIKSKVSRKFKKWFIDELLPKSFNRKNKSRLKQIREELLNNNYKGISETANWVGEQSTKIGFWIWHGYDENEAHSKVSEVQRKNSSKRVLKEKDNPELYYHTRPQRVEYWMKKGFSLDEAKEKVSEIQTTFSLDICIEKYGIEKGKEVFNERQKQWQSKMDYEIIRKNKEESGYIVPLELKSSWELYKYNVWKYTNIQNVENLQHHDKRGRAGIKGAYNLDHKISIKYGFDNSIPPEIIGDIDNLQMLPWEENYSKGTNCYSKIKD